MGKDQVAMENLSCHFPEPLYAALQAATESRGDSPQDVMTKLIRRYIAEVERRRGTHALFLKGHADTPEGPERTLQVGLRETELRALKVLVARGGITLKSLVRQLATAYVAAVGEPRPFGLTFEQAALRHIGVATPFDKPRFASSRQGRGGAPKPAFAVELVEVRLLLTPHERRAFEALAAAAGTSVQQRVLELVRKDLKDAKG